MRRLLPLLLIFLVSCYTPDKARHQVTKAAYKYPGVLAEVAARFIPVKPPVFIPGRIDTITEVRLLTDSVEIPCPPNLTDTLIVKVPGAVQVRTVTIKSVDTVELYNTYEITSLTEKLWAAENTNTINAGRIADLKKDRNWWKWAAILTWILIAAYIGIRIAKPKML